MGRSAIRIVVAGDAKTGKSSLIMAAAAEVFPSNVALVLPPTRLPTDMYPDRVPITIIDSSLEKRDKLVEELKRADAVVLTYACDKYETIDSLSTFWLPELRRLEVKVPVIVVGCKLDLRNDEQAATLKQVMSPIMHQFREIETCTECSACKQIQIVDVFYFAQKAILHPTAPLFDQESQKLQPRCVRALKRIFINCDHDRDGALSDAELNNFQVKCFNAPLQPAEIIAVKRVVQERVPLGVNYRGLTLMGFLYLHELFIEKGRIETTWTVLRKFGYNNEVRLNYDQLPPLKRHPDQSVELTNDAVNFLKNAFIASDIDGDGALGSKEIEDLFSTAPENPWEVAPYKDTAAKDVLGRLALDAFLSQWALMTLLDPLRTVENLIYIGYADDPSSAIRVTRRRRTDRKMQQSDRNVYQCFVFGPEEAGKSVLLNSYIGRAFSEEYIPSTDDHYAVKSVEKAGGNKKTLVLREIPERRVKKFLSSTEALAPCDVAIFVHDSSSEPSWKRASELLLDVASHGEATGYKVSCFIVAAKNDLEPFLSEIQDSTRTSQDMGIEAPIPISTKLQNFSNIFGRIVDVAERPHLSIPETEAGRRRKQYRQQYHRLVNRSLMVMSVGAAVAVVGLVACRVYAARK